MSETLKLFLSAEAKAAGIVFRPPRDSDGGFDLPVLNDVVLNPGFSDLLRTGVHVAIPFGYVGIIRDRSSVALRGGAVTAGVIDSSYRGEVKIVMHNLGKEPLVFRRGERIAQCIIVRHLLGSRCAEVSSLEELGETERGGGGFGSTGM